MIIYETAQEHERRPCGMEYPMCSIKKSRPVGGSIIILGNADGDQYQSAVFDGSILASGQANELIAILDGNAGVVDDIQFVIIQNLFATNRVDEFLEFIFVLKIIVQMEGETHIIGAGGAENADHLIGVPLVERVEIDEGMGIEKVLVLVLEQTAKHGVVHHVVTVDRHVVGGFKYIAGFTYIKTAVAVIIAVKVPVQVVVLFRFALKNGIIDVGVLDVKETHQVIIEFVKGVHVQQHAVRGGGFGRDRACVAGGRVNDRRPFG